MKKGRPQAAFCHGIRTYFEAGDAATLSRCLAVATGLPCK
jgi:hypothetical protein